MENKFSTQHKKSLPEMPNYNLLNNQQMSGSGSFRRPPPNGRQTVRLKKDYSIKSKIDDPYNVSATLNSSTRLPMEKSVTQMRSTTNAAAGETTAVSDSRMTYGNNSPGRDMGSTIAANHNAPQWVN